MVVYLIAAVVVAIGQTADLTHVDTFSTDLQYPGRLAPALGGGIYVTDQPMNQVIEYDSFGTVVGTYPIPEGPVGIASHANGNVYISRLDGVVGIYDAAFLFQGTLDLDGATMTAPNDLAVHPTTGEIYVADAAEHKILVFDGTTDTLVRMWGIEGSALSQFESPQAIAVDPGTDHIIVADVDNFRVQVFDPNGILLFKFGYRTLYVQGTEIAWLARSEGVDVDGCGNIYIADALMGTIRAFGPGGQEIDAGFDPLTGYGTGPGELRVPCDVLILGSAAYVASTNNAAVEVYDLACTVAPLTPAPQAGPISGPILGGSAGSILGRRPPRPPDNPLEIVQAMDSGTYVRALDLNRDRQVNTTDLQLAVDHFGAATVDDFLTMGDGTRDVYPYPLAAPHMIDLPYTCGRCHSFDGAPGGMLTDWGQENLCLSCHAASGRAMAAPIGGAGHGNSHPWGVPAANTNGVAGPDPDSISEMVFHLDNGNIRCGTCHDPHQQTTGSPYLRADNATAGLCKECHRGEGAMVDHAVGTEHGPEYCTDCHDTHAIGDNASLIKETMYSWYINGFTGGMVEAGFTNNAIGVGDGGFVDPDADEFGLCDVCHAYFDDSQVPPVPSADFLALSVPHDENMPACTQCHKHHQGFEPGLGLGLGPDVYVGADTCAVCHPAEHADWSGTLHAVAFNSLPPFFQGDVPADCWECHTVDFDPLDPAGSTFQGATLTPEFAGVQCENCHGAGSEHVDLASASNITIDKDAEMCGACHTDAHHPTFDEWSTSGHAGASANSHSGSCGVCHAPVGEQGDPLVKLDVECVACHDSHAQTGNNAIPAPPHDAQLLHPEVVATTPSNTVADATDPSRFNLCGQCHHSRGRTWGDTSRGPHHSLQGNVFVGEMPVPDGVDVVPFQSTGHALAFQQCDTCHMHMTPFQDAGTGGVPPEAPAYTGHGWHPDYEGCTDCHTAASAEALATDLQAEVQGRLDGILAALGDPSVWEYSCCGGPAEGPGGQDDITDDVKKARFIVKYIEGDASLGVHNPEYVRSMLTAAETLLSIPAPPPITPTVVSITSVNGGAPVEVGGAFTVDFTVEDGAGNPIAMADLDRLRLYVSGPSDNYQRVIEADGDWAHFVQNPDDSYTYTAADPFPSVYLAPEGDSPAYGPADGEMTGLPLLEGTYTVLIESRQVFGSLRKAGDATMDFVLADDPLSPPTLDPREVVTLAACNECHNDLQLHGNNRYAVTGCVICHTVGSEDTVTVPDSTVGLTVKFSEMIHKIHRSYGLPNIVATANGADPYRYVIRGHGGSTNDFSDIGFPILPDGVMDCESCHGAAAQGGQSYTSITRANCANCHDDIDFTTGTVLDQTNPAVADGLLTQADLSDPTYRVFPGGGVWNHTYADDTQCATCHGPGAGADAEVAHQHPTDSAAEGTNPMVEIVSVGGMTGGGGTCFQAGDFFEVTFKLMDDTANPLQLVPGDTSVLDRMEIILAGPTTLYQTIIPTQRPWSNGDLAVPAGNWVDNFTTDGTYTFISEDPFPANYPAQANSIGEPPADQIFSFEGGWGQLYTPGGTPLDNGTYSVIVYGRRVTPTDGEREPFVTDVFDVPFGANDPIVPYAGTVDTASCNACHGRLAFHGFQRYGVESCVACHTAGTQDGGTYESVDLRIMVHKLHNARNLTNLPYQMAGHSGLADFSLLLISSMPGEAAECAECHVNDDWKSPPVRTNMRTWMVACTSCHDAAETAAHADAWTVPGTFTEQCATCHGAGAAYAVEDVHASP
ncbi:MAG TPA: multiheme c-type cytochrome [Phycisphaerae bacterium]|nr:multiheme c-type cytochrome [Phycisphaerae bacterium]